MEPALVELHRFSDGRDPTGIRRAFKALVPEYQAQLDDTVVSAAPATLPDERASRPTPIVALAN
jgi:hypothetical protein